jgi:hypothetical protein
MVREGPEGALVPHLRESSPSRRGRPRKGLERGPARMELRRIPGDLPHKPRKERRGEGGLPGVERYAAGVARDPKPGSGV